MAEVFVDGHCVGFLSDVKLSREEDGAFRLEGDWSGYPDAFSKESLFTISIPRHDIKFLTDKVDAKRMATEGKVKFSDASFLPESPKAWFEVFGDV